MKFGIRGQLADQSRTCVKFLVDRLRGYWVLIPPKLPFPIDLLRRPYNSVALPCDTVISRIYVENRTLGIIYGWMWTIAAKIRLKHWQYDMMYCSFCRFTLTSCRRATITICPRPSPLPCAPKRHATPSGNVDAVSHGQHVLTLTAAATWHANMAVSKAAWWPWWFDLAESGVRVTVDVGYLFACSFGLPMPLLSTYRPDVGYATDS